MLCRLFFAIFFVCAASDIVDIVKTDTSTSTSTSTDVYTSSTSETAASSTADPITKNNCKCNKCHPEFEDFAIEYPENTSQQIHFKWKPFDENEKDCIYSCNLDFSSNSSIIYRHIGNSNKGYNSSEEFKNCVEYDGKFECFNVHSNFKTIQKFLVDFNEPRNLTLDVQDDSRILISWDLSGRCNNFNLHVGGSVENVSGKSFVIPDGFCKDIGLAAPRKGAVPRLFFSVPGMVQNASAILSYDLASLTWIPPEMGDCIVGYVIRIGDLEEVVVENVTSVELKVHLESCTEYNVKIAAKSDTHIGQFFEIQATTIGKDIDRNLTLEVLDEMKIKVSWDLLDNCRDFSLHVDDKVIDIFNNETIIENAFCQTIGLSPRNVEKFEHYRSVPNIIQKLDIIPSNNFLKAKWKAPIKNDCVIGYTLQINQKATIDVDNILTYTFENLEPCTSYTIKVAAKSKTDFGNFVIQDRMTLEEDAPKPTCEVIEVRKTEVDVQCNIVQSHSPRCSFNKVKIYCEANEKLEWTIWNTTNIFDLKDLMTIGNLSEFTNYSCKAYVLNSEDLEGKEYDKFEFTTLQEVPSKPRDFELEDVHSYNFTLTWKEPEKMPSIPTGYDLFLENFPNYFIPDECERSANKSNETIEYKIQSKTIPSNPYHSYTAKIRALSSIGPGDYSEQKFSTNIFKPEQPRNFEYVLSNDFGRIYNVSIDARWKYPCNTFGTFSHFQIYISWSIEGNSKVEMVSDEVLANEDMSNIDYSYVYEDVQPQKNYIVSVRTVLKENSYVSEEVQISFPSPDGYPSEPILKPFVDLSNTSFSVDWNPPLHMNGEFQNYNVSIGYLGAIHDTSTDCEVEAQVLYIYSTTGQSYEFVDTNPNHRYNVSVVASTRAGGKFAASKIHETAKTQAGPVQDLNTEIMLSKDQEKYICHVQITFKPPCSMNSQFRSYRVQLLEDGIVNATSEENELSYSFPLEPSKDYVVVVHTITEYGDGVKEEYAFQSPAGVPKVKSNQFILQNVNYTTASILIHKELFDDDNGDILYYSILVTGHDQIDNTTNSYGYWNGEVLPNFPHWSEKTEAIEKYQATPQKWNPFSGNKTYVLYELGTENCSDDDEFCNGPLVPATAYFVEIRGYTANAYKTTKAMYFETDYERALGVAAILGIVLAVLAVVILAGGGGFYVWRKRRVELHVETEIGDESIVHIPVVSNKFPDYYVELQRNPNILKQEFLTLNTTSAELGLLTNVASLPENKKKNRYTNILPFDDTRVILRCTDSDYINASFVKGISDTPEYIATQGPLECTLYDFWKMVLEQNATVIVMLAQFYEQKREKCYKYFPNDHEQMEIEDIQIRCSTELNYGFYRERHILVQTDSKKLNVIHLQFMNWPDFGCPSGTENMLNFCLLVRKFIDEYNTKAIMHCSAGVGRTGTLIAIDILLQTIACNGDLDIFNTVLNLRKQRKNMVQTEAQYMYIHTCINDAILNPPQLKEIKATEPIYENVKDNLIQLKVLKSDSNENIEMEA